MKNQTIDDLVDDLIPIRRVAPREGVALVLLATLTAAIIIATVFGFRPDIMAGRPEPIIMVRGALLLLLGMASVSAVVASARPGIGQAGNGQASHGWRWALAAAAIFPGTAVVLAITNVQEAVNAAASSNAYYCFGISGVSALVIGAVLTLWLRHGAPTSPERTSWLVGMAAGSFGTFAYSLHCPSDTVYYAGLWYSLVVLMCAGAARILVPRFIRW